MFANDPKRTYQRTRLRAHGDQEDFDCAAIMKIAITVIGFFFEQLGTRYCRPRVSGSIIIG
jgi:hypothetical protein